MNFYIFVSNPIQDIVLSSNKVDKQKVKKYLIFLRDYAVNIDQNVNIDIEDVYELSKELDHFKKQVDSFNINGDLKERIQKLNIDFSLKKKKKMRILDLLVTFVLGPKFNKYTYIHYETAYLRKLLNNFSLELEILIHNFD